MAVADIQGGINFLCQRCQQPLKLSSTLYSLDEHTLAELSLPISPAHNIDIESQVTSNYYELLSLLDKKFPRHNQF